MTQNHKIGDMLFAFFFGQTDKPMIGIIVGLEKNRNSLCWNYTVQWSYTHGPSPLITHNYSDIDITSFKDNLDFYKRKL